MTKVKALLKHGDTLKANGEEFEVITVSCQTDENDQPTAFFYEIVSKADADARREANPEAEA